ncbi:alpha-2-macroglobulin-like protein [Pimephales promelas]|nr:alpha-2-macroglobulin-like protein [Pimephales promelas]
MLDIECGVEIQSVSAGHLPLYSKGWSSERLKRAKSCPDITFDLHPNRQTYLQSRTNGYFRVVSMDPKFVPFDQMYSLLVVEDKFNNRIGQWTNVSSTELILELSLELNPEAQLEMDTLKAFIVDREVSQVFEVKKYVLPKSDVTVNTPQTYSVAVMGLKVESCANVDMAQAVQILVYSVLPSENVVAANVPLDTDMCFQNHVLYDVAIGNVGVSAVFSSYGCSCGGKRSDGFRSSRISV